MTKYASFDQITKLDKLAMEKYNLDILQMMEVAGKGFAQVVKKDLKKLSSVIIAVLVGPGNNGGDGLCTARYLANWGAQVIVILAKNDLKEPARHHLEILKKMNIPLSENIEHIYSAQLIIDSLLGYNLDGNPKSKYSKLIKATNEHKKPIYSFDIPSGLGTKAEKALNPTIKATKTITLAVVKQVLVKKNLKKYVGKLELVDIGIPKQAYTNSNLLYPF